MENRLCPFDSTPLTPVLAPNLPTGIHRAGAGLVEQKLGKAVNPDVYVCPACGFVAEFVAKENLAELTRESGT